MILLGTGLAIVVALVYACGNYRIAKNPRFFFLGKDPLSSKESSRSIFASWMSFGNVIVGALIVAISYNYFAAWAVISWILGFLILARHAPRMISEGSSCLTLPKFLEASYESVRVSKIASLIAIATAMGIVALELTIGAALFLVLGAGISDIAIVCIATLLLGLTSMILAILGGLPAVIDSDRMQSLAIFIGVIAIVLFAVFAIPMNEAGGPTIQTLIDEQVASVPANLQLGGLVAYLLGFGLFQLVLLLGDFSTWTRIQLCGDPRVASTSAKKAAVATLVSWTLLLIAGLSLLRWPADTLAVPGINLQNLTEASALAEPFNSMISEGITGAPILRKICLFAVAFGMVSAILSTIDSFLIVSVKAFLMQFSREGRAVRTASDLSGSTISVKAKRILPLAAAFSALAYALFVFLKIPLLSAILFVLSLQCILAPLVVSALYFPKDTKELGGAAAIASLLSILAIGVCFILSGLAGSVTLSYIFAYAAPLFAVVIPTLTLTLWGFWKRREIRSLPLAIFIGRSEKE